MEKLNKNEIIEIVADATHVSKTDAKKVIDATFELIADTLLDGQSVNIKNFCVFEPKVKSGRKGTHPKKHTEIQIKPKHTVTIHLAREFKNKLNEE
jgi:nucleoid DNA-binding protein